MVAPCSSRISLISAIVRPYKGLEDPAARRVSFASPRQDVPGINLVLVFRPCLGSAYDHRAWPRGPIVSRMIRLCGENPKSS